MILKSSNDIKAEARALGFYACGIAMADAVDLSTATAYREWLSAGCHGEMSYLHNHTDKRLDPRLLMPGVKSIVSVALSYAPTRVLPSDTYQISAYALGQDYHTVLKERLHQLAARIGAGEYRAFCDTAPVLERYWAWRAGIGWIGRNHQLIIPGAGSMFFLGELFLPEELEYDCALPSRCGTCYQCVRACPSGALSSIEGTITFDARRCLSYQTIEYHGALSAETAKEMGNRIYGCDTCQQVCPHMRHCTPSSERAFQPTDALLSMTISDWRSLTHEKYLTLFRGSAVKRAKYEGLMRNIQAVSASSGMTDAKSEVTASE